MIFYFSATGNSLHVTREIAAAGEKIVCIPEAVDKGILEYDVESEERVGIVTPTYYWTMPSIVTEFLEKLVLCFDTKPYIYYVGAFGSSMGAAAKMSNHIMKAKGLPFDAVFDVRMPDTWTPIFDLTDVKRIAEINRQADEQITRVKEMIESKVTGKHTHFTTSYFTGVIGKHLYDSKARLTSKLSVEDTCVGCGLCAEKCPVHVIEMQGKRPVWMKERCTMCLGCLHRCPAFAIQRGPKTKTHGQYLHK